MINTNEAGQPIEILVMDTAILETARNVLKMNASGISFSRTGYTGTYTVVCPLTGDINATYITARILNAAQSAGNEAASTSAKLDQVYDKMDLVQVLTNGKIDDAYVENGYLYLTSNDEIVDGPLGPFSGSSGAVRAESQKWAADVGMEEKDIADAIRFFVR